MVLHVETFVKPYMRSWSLIQSELNIRPLQAEDWELVRSIYLDGIATGHATFEVEAPTWNHWNNAHLLAPRLVAASAGSILGWAALNAVSTRAVYAGIAEVSVYVDTGSRRHGVGRALLETLITHSEREGIWTLQASIFPENVASIGLLKSCGFRLVGTRERIGRMNGIWRDTWLLERRSSMVSSD